MQYTVKLLIHDWPRRTLQSRQQLSVEAHTPERAVELALIQAAQTWPGGKAKAYDVVRDRAADVVAEPMFTDPLPEIAVPMFKRGQGRKSA